MKTQAIPRLIAFIALMALLWATLWILRPTPPEPVESRINSERMFADLSWLAAPEREGRMAGSAGGLAARAWIVERMAEIGLEPVGTEGWLHPFTFQNRQGETIEGAANILGLLRGSLARGPVIVITAHYDHLGVRDGETYHGADDNASGVAAMLELARYFQANQPHYSLLFIAFDAEEHGKLGAFRLFEDQVITDWPVAFNLNMDMVSRDLNNQLFAVGTTHHPELLNPLLDQLDSRTNIEVVRDKDAEWTTASDHAAFHAADIPFIYFGVDDHPDYHKPTDTSDKVDREFYHRAVETVLDFLLLLDASRTF